MVGDVPGLTLGQLEVAVVQHDLVALPQQNQGVATAAPTCPAPTTDTVEPAWFMQRL